MSAAATLDKDYFFDLRSRTKATGPFPLPKGEGQFWARLQNVPQRCHVKFGKSADGGNVLNFKFVFPGEPLAEERAVSTEYSNEDHAVLLEIGRGSGRLYSVEMHYIQPTEEDAEFFCEGLARCVNNYIVEQSPPNPSARATLLAMSKFLAKYLRPTVEDIRKTLERNRS